MRVLLLTHRLPYEPNRGDRIRAYHLLRALARRADVHVLSFVHDPEEESHAIDVRRFATGVTTIRTTPLRNHVRAVAALRGSTPLTHVLLDAPTVQDDLRRAAAASRPDVVLSYCTGMARLALSPPLADRPLVLDMVDVDSEKWRALATDVAPPRRWIYAREHRCLAAFERTCAARARAVLVVNDREAAALRGVAPDARIRVVGNGVDLHHLGRPPLERRRDVVFCGVFNYAPNAHAAAWIARQVWPAVRRRYPDATLSLVGAHPTRAVRGLHSPDDGIVVTGTVSDVRPFLWKASVAAAPLFVARGVQNKVLEAIAAGLPAVVTPAVYAGLPPHVQPACVVAADADAYAAAIVGLLERTETARNDMVQRADIKSLSWSAQLADVPEILRAACAAAPAEGAAYERPSVAASLA